MDYVSGEELPVKAEADKLYVAGFVCKVYSLEHQDRHKWEDLEQMFDLNGPEGHMLSHGAPPCQELC